MTYWLARIDADGDAVDFEDFEVLDNAISAGVANYGRRADWIIAHGGAEARGARELMYHAEEYPSFLFVVDPGSLNARQRKWALGGAGALGLTPHIAFENMPPPTEGYRWRGTSGRRFSYPAELMNLDNFADTSWGNDVTDSVCFSIGDKAYVLWIAAARPFDRPREVREMEGRRFELFELVKRGDMTVQDAIDDKQPGEEIAATDDPAELKRAIDDLYGANVSRVRQRAAAAGGQAASPERKLAADFVKLGPYNGWTFDYEPSGKIYEAHHPDSDLHIQWVVDEPTTGLIGIAAMELDGVLEDGSLPFPKLGRTPQGMLALVRHWLDKYQPAPAHVDYTAERMKLLDLDRGPRKHAPDDAEDDSATRFKLIELNPAPGKRTYRLQKVVAKLEKTATPEAGKAGLVATTPEGLVEHVLVSFLADRATEAFVSIYLNIRNKILGYTEYTSGSVASVQVDTAGIMRDALAIGAVGIITVHNHPTGDPTPSRDDELLWKRIRAAGELMGIPVVDNLIVGGDGVFYSESLEGTGRVSVPRGAS